MRVRLEEIRGKRRLEDIAAELDVAISTVQRWEKQDISIPSLRLPEIARVYGCFIKDIFVDDGDPQQPPEAVEVASIVSRITNAEQREVVRDVVRRMAGEEIYSENDNRGRVA